MAKLNYSFPAGDWAHWIEDALPETMLGSDFLQQYGSHYDEGTTRIDPETWCVSCGTCAEELLYFMCEVFVFHIMQPRIHITLTQLRRPTTHRASHL